MIPLTSPTPRRLLEIAAGSQASQVLFAFVELGLARRLAAGPSTVESLAIDLGFHPLAADRFLDACVALGLVVRDGRTVRNAADVERYLAVGAADGDGGAASALLARRDADSGWARLVDRLRAWAPPEERASRGPEDEAALRALAAQHGLALMVGRALLHAHDFGTHRRMVDLGAGTAAMSIAICERHAGLFAVALDRPAVAALARERVAAAGLAARIEVVTGDFLVDPIPEGADVALLANVLSAASERAERELLRRVARALPEGGVAIVSGWMLDDARGGPLVPVLFCLEDIVRGAPDVERTGATYAAWLTDAGFREVRRADFLPPWSALIARR